MKTASPDTLLLTYVSRWSLRKVRPYDYFAPKDFPLNTGPFWQDISPNPSSQCHLRLTLIVRLAVSKETGVLLRLGGVGCWRGVLASTLAKARICSPGTIDFLPINCFTPMLKSPAVGFRRRVNIVKFVLGICVIDFDVAAFQFMEAFQRWSARRLSER